jgi:outer membrane murein-binding lipoprotein Lpp
MKKISLVIASLSLILASGVFAQTTPISLGQAITQKMKQQIGEMAFQILTLQAQVEQLQQENTQLRAAQKATTPQQPSKGHK